MQENVYERIHRVLTWKRIIAFNAVLFLLLVVPLSVRLAQEDTENRSSAAEDAELPQVTPPPNYPLDPPQIERVSQFFGKTGDTVVVIGNNFGDYQWGSQLVLGNNEVRDQQIVRWSDTIIEAQIGEGAVTGEVSINVNGNSSTWDGTLMVVDLGDSTKIELNKTDSRTIAVNLTNAQEVIKGMIEVSYQSEPIAPTFSSQGTITRTSQAVDSLGKKLQIEFELFAPLSSSTQTLLNLQYPGIGALELTRVELLDSSSRLIEVYAPPLSVKVL